MNTLAFAGLLRLICAVSEPSQPPPPTPLPTAVNEQQESSYAGATSSPTEQPIISPANKDDCINKQHPDRDKESSERLMVRFTRILAFAAVVQLAVMGIQAVFMHLTRRSYEKGERARLWVEDFEFPDLYDNELPNITVTYYLINTGRTSADVYANQMSLRDDFASDDDLPKEPSYEGGSDRPVYFTVPAGRHFFRTMRFSRSNFKNLAKVMTFERSLYLVGYVRYRDAFRDDHTLRFGLKYTSPTDNIVAITSSPGYNVEV